MAYNEFANSEFYDAIMSSNFSYDIYDVSETFEQACHVWWHEMSKENQEIIKSMPNFDAVVFKNITGIEV